MSNQEEILITIITEHFQGLERNIKLKRVAIDTFKRYATPIEIEYFVIAEFVFKAKQSEVDLHFDNLQTNIQFLLEIFEKVDKSATAWDKDVLEDNFSKIIRHYQLCKVQKNYIEESMITVKESTKQKIKKEVGDLESQIKTADENLKKVTSHFDEFKESKGNLYSDIISILGIFSSFLFLAFVGFDGLKEVGKAFALSNSIPIKNVVMISCVLLIFSSLMLYCLLFWVSRLTGRSFVNEKSKCRCVPNFIYRHWPMATYIVVIIAVFLYAFYCM